MSDRQIAAIVLIVVVYYYFHSKGMTAYSKQRGWNSARPNTAWSGASTQPRTARKIPGGANPLSGSGRGFGIAPVVGIGQANNPQAAAPGTGIKTGWTRSSWASGFGTTGISPSWPTSQVTSTKTIRTGKGRIQVPSYATIPTTTQGPGGSGSLLWGGQS